MRLTNLLKFVVSCSVKNVIAFPLWPARPVLPTYKSISKHCLTFTCT